MSWCKRAIVLGLYTELPIPTLDVNDSNTLIRTLDIILCTKEKNINEKEGFKVSQRNSYHQAPSSLLSLRNTMICIHWWILSYMDWLDKNFFKSVQQIIMKDDRWRWAKFEWNFDSNIPFLSNAALPQPLNRVLWLSCSSCCRRLNVLPRVV